LLAASASLREQLGTPRFPASQTLVDEIVARMRDVLGDRDFTREWARGQAMSMDEAIEFALRES
jgi:hypothetical protein